MKDLPQVYASIMTSLHVVGYPLPCWLYQICWLFEALDKHQVPIFENNTAHEETIYIYDKKDPHRKTSMHMMHCHFSLYLQIFEPMHPVFFLVVNSLCSSTRSGNSDPTLQKALQVLMPRGNFVPYLWNAKTTLPKTIAWHLKMDHPKTCIPTIHFTIHFQVPC